MSSNKKAQMSFVAAIVLIVAIGAGVFLADKFNFTGLVIDAGDKKLTGESSEIEIWADTKIEVIEEGNNTEISLLLDNGTKLRNEEIEFYLNDSLVSIEKLENESVSSPFNPYQTIPGVVFEIKFPGNSSLYLNPSSLKFEDNEEITEVSVKEENGTVNLPLSEIEEIKINENATLINLNDYNCKEFKEKVLWSSGYSNSPKGSLNYQTWNPRYTCSELDSECFILDIELDSRLISIDNPENETGGMGFIQISELNNCDVPQSGKYSHYLVYDETQGEEVKREKYCGSRKDDECELEITESLGELKECYGIKSEASQYMIIDAFSVEYNLCSGGENEN